VAVTVRFVGPMKLAPFAGLVIDTAGAVFTAETVMLTGAEVLVALRLSVATAVST
jgi:hypothetical protein